MLIEITLRWPFVRGHRCRIHHGPHHAEARDSHRSYVMTDEGRGWLVRHDSHGYTIELVDGRRIVRKSFNHESR